MSPIVEITSFPASDAFLTNGGCIKGLCKALGKTEGFISAFHGVQIEDKRTVYLVITWGSLEDSKNFQATPEFSEIHERMKQTCSSGPISTIHVEFDGDHTKPLTCPVTEIVMGKANQGKTADDVVAATKFVFTNLHGSKGYHPGSTFGEVVEMPENYRIFIGWDNVEAHKEAVSSGPGKEAVTKYTEVVEHGVVHANFKQCTECLH